MRKTKRLLAVGLGVMLAAGCLGGCGKKAEPAPVAKTEAAKTAKEDLGQGEKQDSADKGTETQNGQETAEAKESKGGSVVIASSTPQQTFFMPQSSSTGDRFAIQPILEPLGRSDSQGNYEPWLAEDFVVDNDALTFTIKLRKDVYFHDGSVCDADAVVWNIEQYIKNGKASEIGSPASVGKTDDLTVVIQYDKWANDWENVIGDIYICSKEAYEKNGAEWCKIHAVGTGPFVFDSYIADTKITYKKNENYRIEGLPKIDTLEIDFIKDSNTVVSALLNKEVNVAMKLNNDQIINTVKAAGYERIGGDTANCAGIKHIIWNSKSDKHPMGDLKVRQAVMHAIDWDNVAKALSGGMGEATPLFCTKDSWAYSPEAEFYEYDVELAKKMLAEAGYPNGFETTIYCISSNTDTATAFQACLDQIGIKAEISVLDSSVLASMQKEDDIDGFIAGSGAAKMDFVNNYIRLYSSEGIKNHGIMLRPAEFEEPLFAARAAKTLEEKKTQLQKAAKALVQDYVMITPLAVVYSQSYGEPGLKDTGISEVDMAQWTPESMYWE